jgi:phosphoglycolate phosphatase
MNGGAPGARRPPPRISIFQPPAARQGAAAMTAPRAAIFDLDGTLLDTLDDLADSANEALTTSGFPPHPPEAYRTFVGDGIVMLVKRIVPPESCDEDTVGRVLGLYRAAYGRRWNLRTKPYDGIPEALGALSLREIKLAVLSNKPHAFTELCIAHHLPGKSFAMVLGQRDHVPRKPDPAAALEIASALDVEPAEVLFIGDSAIDMDTAVAAGMRPVGVTWGFRPVEELRRHGAATIIDHPAAIPGLFASGCS